MRKRGAGVLFNSYQFIFLFLPACLASYFSASYWVGRQAGLLVLAVASLVFYSWWNPSFLGILLLSIAVNIVAARALMRAARAPAMRAGILFAGILFNLGVLCYFKYAAFIAENLNDWLGLTLPVVKDDLPLGISFFTFQKIALLVDVHAGLVSSIGLLNYVVFVTFFPQLLAGPIVHYSQLMPQFDAASPKPRADDFAVGLSIFIIGLFSKCVLADGMAVWADPLFAAAGKGFPISFVDAWVGAFAYSFQLYFDFAGYSTMAIGLARLFGIVLPVNFLSPYKADNIIEFWRRWHMTLSRFLRDYLYIPLGGNRLGLTRKYVNIAVTMVIGGLWHGAAWNFVLWGAIHGVLLLGNHGWHDMRRRAGWPPRSDRAWTRPVAVFLTFIAVTTAWVVFRASDLRSAGTILSAMYDVDASAASMLYGYLKGQALLVTAWRWHESSALLISVVAAIAFFCPNVTELFAAVRPGLIEGGRSANRERFVWRPNPGWAVTLALAAMLGLLQLGQLSPFLYFQF